MVLSVKTLMRFVFILLAGVYFNSVNSQNLYLKIESENAKHDSLIQNLNISKKFNDFKSLQKTTDKILNQLQFKGYLNLRAKELEKINDSLFKLNINLRNQYKVVYLKNHLSYPILFQEIEPYIKVEELSNTLYSILNKFSQEGKPFSQVRLKEIEFNQSDTVFAEFELYQSNKRTLDEIVLRGYDKFPKSFLKNYAGLKTGNIFNKEKLIRQAENLEALAFVNQTKNPQIQFMKDTTKLFLYMKRRKANSFDGFLGFNNSDENDFQLNGNIDLKLINNFHGGEEINLNYRNDGNAQEWFDIGVRLPYVFRTRFSLEAGLGFFKQDSTFSNTTQQVKLDYQIGQSINLGVKAKFEKSNNLLDNDEIQTDIQDFDKNSYGIEAVYQNSKRYNPLFLNSQYVNFGIGIGRRETDLSSEQQQYITLDGRQIFKINKRQYIYIGLNAGFLNSNQFLSNELYRFGGINSIRGFAENRFFANFFGTSQTEYRYILGSNLYIHSVLDYGFYENDINRFSENLYSLGLGFGLETQAGVLRLIFANGGSNNQNIEFKNTQIHIKFISIF